MGTVYREVRCTKVIFSSLFFLTFHNSINKIYKIFLTISYVSFTRTGTFAVPFVIISVAVISPSLYYMRLFDRLGDLVEQTYNKLKWFVTTCLLYTNELTRGTVTGQQKINFVRRRHALYGLRACVC